MKDFSSILYREFVAGKSWRDWCFLSLGIVLQVLVFVFRPAGAILIVSGLAGVFSVVLCSQGKISSFFFGFVQVVTYIFITYNERLYAEVAINVFYFLTMVYGVFSWLRTYEVMPDSGQTVLRPRSLPLPWRLLCALAALLCSAVVGWLLQRYTDDSQPYLDAFTTVPAIVAQCLMVMRYRNQWYYWFLIDVLAVVMWCRAENWSMAALYLFWCMNCVYGLRNWKLNEQKA